MSPTYCTHARDEAEPVAEQDENEDGSKKPKRFAGQLGSEDAFEKADQAFNDPLDKILQAGWHQLGLLGGNLRDKNQAQCHDPRYYH